MPLARPFSLTSRARSSAFMAPLAKSLDHAAPGSPHHRAVRPQLASLGHPLRPDCVVSLAAAPRRLLTVRALSWVLVRRLVLALWGEQANNTTYLPSRSGFSFCGRGCTNDPGRRTRSSAPGRRSGCLWRCPQPGGHDIPQIHWFRLALALSITDQSPPAYVDLADREAHPR